jgi:hypothetical protein
MGSARLGFDRLVRLEFHGLKICPDGRLLLIWELDDCVSRISLLTGLPFPLADSSPSFCDRYAKSRVAVQAAMRT